MGRSTFVWPRDGRFAKNRTRLACAVAAGLTLAGCNSPAPPFPDLPHLSVSTRFAIENLCNIGVSPPIQLGNVPDKTTTYVVQITDIYVLLQTPWREEIPLTSKTEIPEGAAKTYAGPCLGDFTRFDPVSRYGYQHRVEVLAEDATGKPLAYGSTIVNVESAYIVAKRARTQSQQGGGTGGGAPPPASSTAQPTALGPIGPVPGAALPPSPSPNMGVFR